MATTKYNWKDIPGANIHAQLDNVAKSYTSTRALHIIQLIHSIHKSWENIDQIRSVRENTLNGLTHGSFTQMLTLDKFIRMCDFDSIELDTINVEQLRKLLFNPPADGSGDPRPDSNGLVGWYFPLAGPVQLCEVVNPYSDRNDEIQEAQDLLNDQKNAVGVHVLRFQLKKWCDSNPQFREVLQLKAENAQLEHEMTAFLNDTLRLPKSVTKKPGEYLVKNDGSFPVSSKRGPITEQEITEWTRLKNEYQRLNANVLLRENIRFPRIINWALTTAWTLNGTQLSNEDDRKGGILHLLNVFGCGMNGNQFDAIFNQGFKNNVALTSQLNDFVGSNVGEKQSRIRELTRDANSWLKNNAEHDVLINTDARGNCRNKLVLQVLTTWKQGRMGFTNIGEEISLCFEDYHRFFLLPHPRNLNHKVASVFDSYIEAKNYVVYGIALNQHTDGTHPSLSWYPGLNLTGQGARVKWRSYFQRSIRTPYKQYGESPSNQENVPTGRDGANLLLDTTPDPTNADFSRQDRNPTPAIKAVKQAGRTRAGQCCAVCSKRIKNGTNRTWSTYLGGTSSGQNSIGQSFDVDHIANLIYNELFKLNTGGHGFLNTCTGCNQHFKSEKIWCPSYNLWYYLLAHAYGELATLLAQFQASGEQYMPLTPEQFFECYPWPGWKINGIPGIVDRVDYSQEPAARLVYDARTKISEFNMYCTINSYGNTVPAVVNNTSVRKPPRRPRAGPKRNMWDQGQGMGSTKNAGSTRGMGDFNIVSQSQAGAQFTALKLETIILDRFANILRMTFDNPGGYDGHTLVNNIIGNEYNRLKLAMRVKGNTATGCTPVAQDGGFAIATEYGNLTAQFPVVARFEEVLKEFQDALSAGSVSSGMRILGSARGSSSGTNPGFSVRVSEDMKQQQIEEGRMELNKGMQMIATFRAQQQDANGFNEFDRMDIKQVFPATTVSRDHFMAATNVVNQYLLSDPIRQWATQDTFTTWARDILAMTHGKGPSIRRGREGRRYRARTETAIHAILDMLLESSDFSNLNCADLDAFIKECLRKLSETGQFIARFKEEAERLQNLRYPNKSQIDEGRRLQREFNEIVANDLIPNNIRFGLLYNVLNIRRQQVQCAMVQSMLSGERYSRGPAVVGAVLHSEGFSQSQGSQGETSGSGEDADGDENEGGNARMGDIREQVHGIDFRTDEEEAARKAAEEAAKKAAEEAAKKAAEEEAARKAAEEEAARKAAEEEAVRKALEQEMSRTPVSASGIPSPGSGNLGSDEMSPESPLRARRPKSTKVIPFAPGNSAFSAVSEGDESGSDDGTALLRAKRRREEGDDDGGGGGDDEEEADLPRPPSRRRGDYDGIQPFIRLLTGPWTFQFGQWVDWDQVDNAIRRLAQSRGASYPNLVREWRNEHSSQARRDWFIGYLNHIGAIENGSVGFNRNSGRFRFREPRGFGRGGRKRTRKKRRRKKKTKRRRKYRKKTKGRKRRRKKRTRRK